MAKLTHEKVRRAAQLAHAAAAALDEASRLIGPDDEREAAALDERAESLSQRLRRLAEELEQRPYDVTADAVCGHAASTYRCERAAGHEGAHCGEGVRWGVL